MSSSFLKPWVTPTTALATRLRARPWNLPSCLSSARTGLRRGWRLPARRRCPGAAPGAACPSGPCTSTAPSDDLDLDAARDRDGFLADSGHVQLTTRCRALRRRRPAARFAPGHHAARRGQDGGAEAAEDRRHVFAPEVDAAAGPADPLDSGDHALAARTVLELDADRLLDGALALAIRRLHRLEALDVALELQDLGDLQLERRRRNVHARVPRDGGVPDPRQHVGNRIGHRSLYSFLEGGIA